MLFEYKRNNFSLKENLKRKHTFRSNHFYTNIAEFTTLVYEVRSLGHNFIRPSFTVTLYIIDVISSTLLVTLLCLIKIFINYTIVILHFILIVFLQFLLLYTNNFFPVHYITNMETISKVVHWGVDNVNDGCNFVDWLRKI